MVRKFLDALSRLGALVCYPAPRSSDMGADHRDIILHLDWARPLSFQIPDAHLAWGSAVFVITALTLDWGWFWVYGALSGGSFPFALGAAAYHYREQIEAVLDQVSAGAGAVLILRWGFMFGVLLLYVIGFRDYRFTETGNQINSILTALVVVRLFSLRLEGKFKQADRVLGDFSYPVYLLHWQAGLLASLAVFGETAQGANVRGVIVFVAAMPILFLLCSVCVFLIDPVVQSMRDKVRRRAMSGGETRATLAADPP